jgi:hypothetical protein
VTVIDIGAKVTLLDLAAQNSVFLYCLFQRSLARPLTSARWMKMGALVLTGKPELDGVNLRLSLRSSLQKTHQPRISASCQ